MNVGPDTDTDTDTDADAKPNSLGHANTRTFNDIKPRLQCGQRMEAA